MLLLNQMQDLLGNALGPYGIGWGDFLGNFKLPSWRQFDAMFLRHMGRLSVEQVSIVMVIAAVVGAMFLRGGNRKATP